MTAGDAIRQARELAGLSLRDVARFADLSPATLSDVEAGGDARLSTLVALRRELPTLTAASLLDQPERGPAPASVASWAHVRDVLGFSVARLTLAVRDEGGRRSTHLAAVGIRATGALDPATVRRVLPLVVMGSTELRPRLRDLDLREGETTRLDDGGFTHVLRTVRRARRLVLDYERLQSPGEVRPGTPAAGGLAVSGPLERGLSLPIDLAIESLELRWHGVAAESGARIAAESGARVAAESGARIAAESGVRIAAWAVQQPVPPQAGDLARALHGDGVLRVATARGGELRGTVPHPVPGLHYGMGFPRAPSDTSYMRSIASTPAAALAAARAGAGLSQRQLAAILGVSPATVAACERGQDVRASVAAAWIRATGGPEPQDLLPVTAPPLHALALEEAWELQRRTFGLEADAERKTLQVSASGDAHVLCETVGLRRVRPEPHDLRVRYSSAPARGKRLPTVLREIEDALAADAVESGLRARVVERRDGRLIHEIIVPTARAQSGVSFSRRLFDAGFFAPPEEGATAHDGAALVPSHPTARLELRVLLPPGWFPKDVIAAVHPRMALDGPLPEADVAARLHPEGLALDIDPRRRTITLVVDKPLVGFMYDVFWETASR